MRSLPVFLSNFAAKICDLSLRQPTLVVTAQTFHCFSNFNHGRNDRRNFCVLKLFMEYVRPRTKVRQDLGTWLCSFYLIMQLFSNIYNFVEI